MLKNLVLVIYLIFSSLSAAAEVKVKFEDGALTLEDFLGACEEAAGSAPSPRVHPGMSGKIIKIKGKLYEVRYFSFEDTSGRLAPEMTFQDYAKKNNLLPMKSIAQNVLPGIYFESFDFRRSALNDGVYFSMAIREVEKNP